MVTGIALTLAALAILMALVSLLIALWAVGKVTVLTKRLDDAEVRMAGFDGHRIRIDTNIMALANRAGLLASVNGVPLVQEPRSTQ